MSEKETIKLDLWLAQNVVKLPKRHLDSLKMYGVYFPIERQSGSYFSPTTDAADAMKVLDKCLEKASGIHIMRHPEGIEFVITAPGVQLRAETLPLAICLFARQLSK